MRTMRWKLVASAGGVRDAQSILKSGCLRGCAPTAGPATMNLFPEAAAAINSGLYRMAAPQLADQPL